MMNESSTTLAAVQNILTLFRGPPFCNMAVSGSGLPSLSTLTCVSPVWKTPCQEALGQRLTQACHLWGLVDLLLFPSVNSICGFCLFCFV